MKKANRKPETTRTGIARHLSAAAASAFYIGFIPGAPGTYASIATSLAFFLVYLHYGRIVPELHASAVCLITAFGVFTAAEVSRNTGVEDPRFVVIDEVAGQLTTFLFLPVNLVNILLGTLLFRIFDIWKPFPIRKLESLRGGVGVMADDLLAGIYGNLVLQLISRIL
jgi:phosphatidylglycerophosphatase A